MTVDVPPEVQELRERVGKGVAWLLEHDVDPPNRFHLWYESGITLIGKHHGPEVQAAYDEYRKWRRLYEQLETKLAAAERAAGLA